MPEARKPFARSISLTGFLIGVLSLTLAFVRNVSAFQPDTPVTPNASPEAQSLLAFFSDIYGRKTLSGQQRGWRNSTNEISFEFDYIKRHTGKLPAIMGLDLSGATMERPGRTNLHEVVNQAIDWHRRNGVVMICWHWHAPTGKRAFYTKDTDFDLRQALIEGTPEHAGILRDIDTIAEELKLLRDAHVPVLWRPLHEANGRWFWWGAQGAEPCAKLWRLMFDRLTTQHHLNNLIWVFSPGASMDLADWYPGDAYVDIIGQDHYPMDGNHAPAKDVFDELVAFGGGTKLVGMSENGPIPDLELMQREKVDWLFFVTWSGDILTGKNTPEQLRAAFNHPRVLNLGDLPEVKTYPFKSAGKPVKLAFPGALGPVAINGFRRSPLIVAVEDETGRTVRDQRFEVTLALQKSSSSARLTGTLTQPTVNGIATFPDVQITSVDDACVLIASAKGLQSATSKAFEVGPGSGLSREWWNGAKPVDFPELHSGARTAESARTQSPKLADKAVRAPANEPERLLVTPASGKEILLKALEVPAIQVTNYATRLRGWLLPPATGDYTFWIANVGLSELWLSTDTASSNSVKIAAITDQTPYAKWPHCNEAGSKPVRLEAGKRYYLEIRHRLDSGLANLCVRWQLPDGSAQRPIPAERFAPFSTTDTPTKIAQKSAE